MKRILILIAFMVLIAGCSTNDTPEPIEQTENPEFKSYDGDLLRIAVIGEQPTIKEKDLIKFISLELNQLNQLDSSKYDAIFIMNEYLEQAAEDKYAKVYRSTSIPFFFIQSKKSFIPFITEDISYTDADEFRDQTYATGFLQQNKEEYQSWGYGLYNDKVSEINIKDAYSRIFSTIQSIKNGKEK